MTKYFNYLTITVIGLYIVYLYYVKKLNFLIHERYIIFTLIAGIILVVIGLSGIIKNPDPKNSKFKISINFAMLVLAILIPFIPLRSLSSNAFDSRSLNGSVRVSSNEKQDITQKIKFSVNTNDFTIYDWLKAKGLDDLSVFKDKEFTGTGFITPKEGSIFSLSRFIVSCCVVDASPVGILVEYDYNKEFKANDWLEVKGQFKIIEVNGIKEPVIVPTSVIKINQPDSVYLNRN
jgi:putative membrane protein